jgi:cytochrome c553
MLGLLAGLGLPALAATPEEMARAEEIVGGRCFLCHGMEGESASAVFPRLAGQHSEYIARQLADFKSGKRKSDTMKPQSEELTPAEMKALGIFFEGKKVGPRPPAMRSAGGRQPTSSSAATSSPACPVAPAAMATRGLVRRSCRVWPVSIRVTLRIRSSSSTSASGPTTTRSCTPSPASSPSWRRMPSPSTSRLSTEPRHHHRAQGPMQAEENNAAASNNAATAGSCATGRNDQPGSFALPRLITWRPVLACRPLTP